MAATTQDRRIVYSSTVRGPASLETGRETVFHGLAVKIPASEFTANVTECGARELEAIEVFIASLPPDVEVGQLWERYEAWDIETDSVLVLWRIPVHQKEDALAGRKN